MADPILVGRCSICEGPVTVPALWSGARVPVATCERCGARAAQPAPPVIRMERPTKAVPGVGLHLLTTQRGRNRAHD